MSEDPFATIETRFSRGLEVKPLPVMSGYRGLAETPLEGEWLGGYSDSRMLEPFSAMRVVFDDERGSGQDDLGKSAWMLASKKNRNLIWFKKYPGGTFTYHGRKLPHAFVGAWTTTRGIERAGCFWLVPAGRLSPKHAAKLRRHAKLRMWPAGGAQALSFLMVGASIPAIGLLPWWLFPIPFVLIWFALKDGLHVPGLAKEALSELYRAERVRIAEDLAEELGLDEHEEEVEEVEELAEVEGTSDERSA